MDNSSNTEYRQQYHRFVALFVTATFDSEEYKEYNIQMREFSDKKTVFERYVHKLDANYDLRPFTTSNNFDVKDRANSEYRELT